MTIGRSIPIPRLRQYCLKSRSSANYLRWFSRDRKAEVVILAEFHHSWTSKKEIAERALPVLRRQRKFTHLGLEAVSCSHQAMLDDFRFGRVGKPELVDYFRDYWKVLPWSYADVVAAATQLGLRSIALGPPLDNGRLIPPPVICHGVPEEMGLETDYWLAINTLEWRAQQRGRGRMVVVCGVLHGLRRQPRYAKLLELKGVGVISLRLVGNYTTDCPPLHKAVRRTELAMRRWAVDLKEIPAANLGDFDGWIYAPR